MQLTSAAARLISSVNISSASRQGKGLKGCGYGVHGFVLRHYPERTLDGGQRTRQT
jgi:hypothetical protein